MKTGVKRALIDLACIAVVVAAGVVAAVVEGPGFICPSAGILAVGAILLHGLTKLIRGQVRRRVIALIVLTVFAGVFVGCALHRGRPQTVFRKYVADPIPPSVRLLHSQFYGGREPSAYLHFEIDPKDFEKLLQLRAYERSESSRCPLRGLQPDWWPRESLADLHLHVWPTSEREGPADEMVWLWVNEERTEVYFCYLDF